MARGERDMPDAPRNADAPPAPAAEARVALLALVRALAREAAREDHAKLKD